MEDELSRKQKIIIVLGTIGVLLLSCLVARLLFPAPVQTTPLPPPVASVVTANASAATTPEVGKTRFPSPTPLPTLSKFEPLELLRPQFENSLKSLQQRFLELDANHTLIENQTWCDETQFILTATKEANQQMLALSNYPPDLAQKITRLQTRSQKIEPILVSFQSLLTNKDLAVMTDIKKQFLASY